MSTYAERGAPGERKMSKLSYEIYGLRATQLNDPTLVGGRYFIQKESEKRILPDIMRKLEIEPTDECLDIGCNIGNILIPLSFIVRSVVGIDHPTCVARLNERFPEAGNIRLLAGNFLDLEIEGAFDKIIIYGVLQCLKDANEVLYFIDKAASLLRAGGKLLIGDVSNVSLKRRFQQSEAGKAFEVAWQQEMKDREMAFEEAAAVASLPVDKDLVEFNDELVIAILSRMRADGYSACVLPQHPDLPFGRTREDILIHKIG
jgi:2-polyprenyl-3-methyl-5-hydroxy-6-metoxy-1,4-benzoquinol methylase